MKGDEYLCRTCERKWRSSGKEDQHFCSVCYSRELVNLTAKERAAERKSQAEARNREKREKLERMRRKVKRAILKKREKDKRYYRGKN